MRPRSDKYTFININTSIVGHTRLTLYTKTTVKHEYTQRKQIKLFTIITKKWRLKSDAHCSGYKGRHPSSPTTQNSTVVILLFASFKLCNFLWYEAIFLESFTIYWWTFITRLLIQKHLHINQICNASFGGVGGPGGGISYKENYLFTWPIFKTGGNIYMTRPKMDIFVSLLAAWLLQIPSKTSHIFIKWHFGPSSNYRVRCIKSAYTA